MEKNMTLRKRVLDNWQETFKNKLISPQEAAKLVKSGDRLFLPNGYWGGDMLGHIMNRHQELKDVIVDWCAPLLDPGVLSAEMYGPFKPIIRIYLSEARAGHDEGRIPFVPFTNGTWIKHYRDNRDDAPEIDMLLMEVSPPDKNGFMTFGNGVWESLYHTKTAKIVIAEMDRNIIRVHGDAAIHVSEVDYIVDITAPQLTSEEVNKILTRIPPDQHDRVRGTLSVSNPKLPRKIVPFIDFFDEGFLKIFAGIDEPNEVQKGLARNLKTLIKDGDTIQIGTGKNTRHIVNLGVFDDCQDLGIFSELGCPGLALLVQRGIATGKYATLHPGKAVFTGLQGMTPEDMAYVDDNPLFELYAGEYVVNIANISKNDRMVSINNIVGVDFAGQITCESQFGPRLINGAGGQIEFHIGAYMSKGGKSISMMASTYGDGEVSNIVPYFEKGTLITLSRYWADYVVTEYGVAALSGKTHRERAEELIRVAHPKFREELSAAAKEFF
jgi:4-hydroxybutyrate CoA-transferase